MWKCRWTVNDDRWPGIRSNTVCWWGGRSGWMGQTDTRECCPCLISNYNLNWTSTLRYYSHFSPTHTLFYPQPIIQHYRGGCRGIDPLCCRPFGGHSLKNSHEYTYWASTFLIYSVSIRTIPNLHWTQSKSFGNGHYFEISQKDQFIRFH